MDNRSGFKGKRTERQLEAATDSGPKPADYPIGSPESRAAARAMISAAKKEENVLRIQIIYVSPDGTRTEGPRHEIPSV